MARTSTLKARPNESTESAIALPTRHGEETMSAADWLYGAYVAAACANLPYGCPTEPPQPVVRIPVSGPSPFNTLAIVRQLSLGGSGTWDDNDLNDITLTIATPLKLIGFDPRVTPAPQHSTAVHLQQMQSTDNFRFVAAINDVSGSLADDGTWMLTVDTATLAAKYDILGIQENGPWAVFNFYASSWVLCYEPPPLPIPGVDPGRPNIPLTPTKGHPEASLQLQTRGGSSAL